MNIKATKKVILTCLAFASFTLKAQTLDKPSITFTIKSERGIGPWSATQDAIRDLEESIEKELEDTAKTICAALELVPKAESDPVFTTEFGTLLRVIGSMNFACEAH